jgi:hypothetical protein
MFFILQQREWFLINLFIINYRGEKKMKGFLTLLLLAALGYGAYYYFFEYSISKVEVTGNITVYQGDNMNINAPRVSGPLYTVVVNGEATNNSEVTLKNVIIKYKVAGQIANAVIFDMAPGQKIPFTTKSIRTKALNPSFYFEGVQHD